MSRLLPKRGLASVSLVVILVFACLFPMESVVNVTRYALGIAASVVMWYEFKPEFVGSWAWLTKRGGNEEAEDEPAATSGKAEG